ncbi:unnamed protein product [Effrenium voratum]|nr:unnamed protein product [Effrenium voratum]
MCKKDLLQQVAEEKVPKVSTGELSGLWTLQAYVEPRYGLRIISAYHCNSYLEERSDIFSHRFRGLYPPPNAEIPVPDGAKDSPKELETPYRQAIESKTLGIARFAHKFHQLDLDGMVLEFIFDLQGRIVLHGCWAFSICDRPRRAAPPGAQVIWQQPRVHSVPRPEEPEQVPKIHTPPRPRKAADPAQLLLEFWQGEALLGEAAFDCPFHTELRVLPLAPRPPAFSPEALGQCGNAVVSLTPKQGQWLVFKLGRAEALKTESEDPVHVWPGEAVQLPLPSADRSGPRPSPPVAAVPTPEGRRCEARGPEPELDTVKSPYDHVCGAELAAHWGMSEKGVLQGHLLAHQATQRLKLSRSNRTGLLKQLAERVVSFHNMNRQWEIFLETMKSQHQEAQKKLKIQEEFLDSTKERFDACHGEHEQALAGICRRMSAEVDELRHRERLEADQLANSQARVDGQRQKVQELEAQKETLQTSLGRVRCKLDDLAAEDVKLRQQLEETRAQHLAEQAAMLKSARISEDLVELQQLKKRLAATTVASGQEHKHILKMEDFVRRVANQDARSLRTGGGYILDSLAKAEAKALLQELGLE